MRRVMLIALIILSALLASGCFGARETDEIAYVLSIGFDKSKNEEGKFDVTYQIAVPRAIAGEGAKGEDVSIVITVTAESLAESRSMLNSIVARTPNLGHVKVIVIGESLARQGLGEVIGPLTRIREYRGSVFVIVVNGDTAQNFIKRNHPKIDIVPSRYFETMLLTADETSYFPKTNLHEFYNRLKSGSAAPFCTLGGINPSNGFGQVAEKNKPPSKADRYEAGNIPLSSGDIKGSEKSNPVEFVGAAVFHGDKMVGTLNNGETQMVAILNGEFARGIFGIDDPLEPKKAALVNLRLGRKTKLKADIVDGKAYLEADIFLEGEITTLPSGINYESAEYRPLLEEQVSQMIQQSTLDMLRKTQTMKSDIVGFGYVARGNFSTYDEYKKIKWGELYSQAEITVNVETKIRRTGLLWKTRAINKGE